jgi:uncharacterized protein (DUF58 family)
MTEIQIAPSSALRAEHAAREVADRLPALLLEARRVAATVAQGVHGRRRAGPGETFWQFRNFTVGDSAALIDWRRSAGSDHLYLREREWEAAHTVWIWTDLSHSMNFRSHLSRHTKAERAIVLALALASLLSSAGERVGIPGHMEPKARRNVTRPMMEAFVRPNGGFQGLPGSEVRLSQHSEIVIFSDFLEALDRLDAVFAHLAKQGVRGHLVQILDPAEESLPYQGRVEFLDAEAGTRFVAERAESLREAYAERLAMHKAAIARTASSFGWTPFLHHTDRPAVEALLTLHMHLSGLEKAYRSKGMLKGSLAGRSISS